MQTHWKIVTMLGLIHCLLVPQSSVAEVRINLAQSELSHEFEFATVPRPSNNDAGTSAIWKLITGTRDKKGAGLQALHDGKIPQHSDDPSANFFFTAGTDGGRLLVDFGKSIAIKQVNSYSWHVGSRAPQVYRLYVPKEVGKDLNLSPQRPVDPATCGWRLLADVDTRVQNLDGAGQNAVGISDSSGAIGNFRYLLFDIRQTESTDPFGNTFFSEIDVVDATGPPPTWMDRGDTKSVRKTFESMDGQLRLIVDATVAPDLLDWSEKSLVPIVMDWYPKIVELLPSENFQARREVLLNYRDDMGGTPASAGGGRVNLNARWFRSELDREAKGAVIHELVHVVQDYHRGLRLNQNAARTPGWIVEGIPDYIRWFLYEPQTRGAEITRRQLLNAKYDSSYRITANFLNWVTQTYDKDLIRKLNAASREGRYQNQLWKDWTGKSLSDLETEWKQSIEIELNQR